MCGYDIRRALFEFDTLIYLDLLTKKIVPGSNLDNVAVMQHRPHEMSPPLQATTNILVQYSALLNVPCTGVTVCTTTYTCTTSFIRISLAGCLLEHTKHAGLSADDMIRYV